MLIALASHWLIGVAHGQTFSTLKSFGTNDGTHPWAGLTLSGSVLYGTAESGGCLGSGTVFQVNTDGTGYTVLKNFDAAIENSSNGTITNTDGGGPRAGLTLSGTTLYGTTQYGGRSGGGTVFKVNTDSTSYTVLKNFDAARYSTNTDGGYPPSGLTLSGTTLYGTTVVGGSSGNGTVFKMNTDGTGYTVLKNFNGTDGAYPRANLTLSGSTLYGTTESGGSSKDGTVFQVNTDGTGYTVLKHFTGSDGAYPHAGLTLSGSVLYGTTHYGGSSGNGTVFKVNTDGTGYTVLKHFSAASNPPTATYTNTDGAWPVAGLTLSGSVLYGTTESGGMGYGTVFQVNTNGTGFMVLKSFNAAAYNSSNGTITNTDGAYPQAGLTLSGSVLYGTTSFGGSLGFGTVFKLDLPIRLTIQSLGNAVVLSWTDPAFALQAAPAFTGIYTNVPGALSPSTNPAVGPQGLFRLKRN